MNIGNFFLLLFSFCNFIVGFFVWFKRSDRLGTIYLIYSCLMAAWGSLLSFTLSDDIGYKSALLSVRISNSAALFIGPTWYYFTLLFCKFKNRAYYHAAVCFYVISLLLLVTVPTDLFISDLHSISGFKFYPTPGPAYSIFMFLFYVAVLLSFINLYKRIKVVQGKEKKRVIGMFAAAAFGYLGGGLSFLPVYDVPVPMYNFMIMPLYPFLLAYFITRENLFDAEKFAEIAHKEKLATIGTLAASVNHEIRNPLYIIKSQGEGFVEKFEEGFYQGEEGLLKSREIIQKSIAQSKRAMDIMKRFSKFAKPQSEEPAQIKVNLSSTLKNVMQLVSYEVTTEEIGIDIQVDSDLEILFDPRHLEQILFNLIRNACQEMEKRGAISICAMKQGASVELKIADNGSGMPPDRLKQVFEPFYSTKEEGSGLGLYVTKQLMDQNNAKISVASEVNKGTAFTLEFRSEPA